MTDSEKVLSWLTSEDVFSTGDEIEDVNRHMLDKLLNEEDFVAVFFCKYLSYLDYLKFSNQMKTLFSFTNFLVLIIFVSIQIRMYVQVARRS